ncbi:MAG: glycosyltransferase family 2 protein [Gemmatimonadaceae bacterium]
MLAYIALAALAALALLLWLPTLADLAHVFSPRVRTSRGAGPPTRFLFLVPAHDEELLIADCIKSLYALDYPRECIAVVVVADNCSDRTAEVARAAGATVLERHHATDRGKQFALAWAITQVPLAGHDAVVVVDADTALDRRFAAELDAHAPLAGVVAQPFNDVENRTDNALTRMAAVQSQALHGLGFQLKATRGISVPLSAGMTLGTDVLRTHGWPAFSIGEDFELYVILTLRGVPFRHSDRARVFAQEARDLKQGSSQRKRWMAGRIYVLKTYLRETLTSPRIGWRQRLDLLGEMTVTALGPATQVALTLMLATIAWFVPLPAGRIVALLLLASLLRLVTYAVLAILRDPEPMRAAMAFVRLPPYILWRVSVALRSLVTSGTGAWVRTARHERRP